MSATPDTVVQAPSADPAGRRWHFGPCMLDERSLELRVGGNLVHVDRQPLEVLLYLLHHAGEVVTKDELAESCWPGRILSETVLAKCISRLRAALGDEQQAVIKTVHRYGYRLVAPVRVELPAERPAVSLDLVAGECPPLRPHWRLLELLGAGGFGETWRARHEPTGTTRIYKFARDGTALASLKREITLSRLLRTMLGDRGCVVPILGWNLDVAPYFLEAEDLGAQSLGQWAEAQGGVAALPLAQRIELAAQAAEALAAVHGVGVLHKDLKPANILVSGPPSAPRVTLTDFGSGTVLDPQRLEEAGITRLGFTHVDGAQSSGGTPMYVAPEVLAGQPLTTQADIYALGVLLYQLVVGDLRRALAPAWEADVTDELLREDITAAAAGDPARRLSDAALLAQRLRALEARRRERAAAEEARLETLRNRRAVQRLRQRRAWLLSTIAALAVGLSISVVMFFQARQAREQALEAAAASKAVSDFLSKDFLTASLQSEDKPTRGLTPRELLDRAAELIPQRFAGQPLAEADIRTALAKGYILLREAPPAITQMDRALELYAAHRDGNPAGFLDAVAHSVILDFYRSTLRERVPFYEETLAYGVARLGPEAPAVLVLRSTLAGMHSSLGYPVRSVEILGELIATMSAMPKPDEAELAANVNTWAFLRVQLGYPREAEQSLRASLARARERLGPDHHAVSQLRHSLALCLVELGRHGEAEAELDIALEGARRATFSDESGPVFNVLLERARLRREQGRPADAIEILRGMLGKIESRGPAEDRMSGPIRLELAQAYQQAGRKADALAEIRRARAFLEQANGEHNPQTLRSRILLADLLREQGDSTEAARTLATVDLAGVRERLGERHLVLAEHARVDGLVLMARGDAPAGRAALAQALRLYETAYGAEHWRVQELRKRLAPMA